MTAMRLRRLARFVGETHPPRTYAFFTSLWSISFIAVVMRVAGRVELSWTALLVPATYFFVLLFLRAVDEIKDLDYDRRYNPERPLVRGGVSVGEVAGLAATVGLAVIVLNLTQSLALAGFVALDLCYGLVLLGLERVSRTFREAILLNLVVTFPVSAALNVYAFLFLVHHGLAPGFVEAAPVILAYVAGFLHFEFGRKLKWPQLTQAGENGYAMVLGPHGAVAVAIALGLAALGSIIATHTRCGAGAWAWLPIVAVVPSYLGLRRFYGAREREQDLKPWFALALVLFFASNLAVALLTRPPEDSSQETAAQLLARRELRARPWARWASERQSSATASP